ncbi:hypothetical protein C8R43DRAFT_1031472 [Mycena crocata]|nr:hypothetical protein C8R43DRAFT_1031472 [Mycena crocata]
MHACLTLPEILDEICCNLDSHVSFRARRDGLHGLAALARTCRLFHHSALAVLWQQATLDDLLQCLPVDLMIVRNIGNKKRMRLRRPVRAEDWDRVILHARYIRNLRCTGGTSLDILPRIGQSLPDNLLPKLTGVFCGPLHFSFLALIFGPSLQKLQLHLVTPPSTTLFPTLVHKCPQLTELRIHEGSDGWEEISPFFYNFRFLECVEVHCLDWGTLYHLGQLTSLRTLELTQLPETSPPPLTTSLFPALVNIKLSPSTSVRYTTHLLNSFRDTPLASFNLIPGSFYGAIAATPTASEWHDLFSSLESGCSHTSLEELQIHSWEVDEVDTPDVENYLIPPRAVQLLFCFFNLTQVCIESGIGFALDDDTVGDMARAWPRLTLLELTAVAGNVPPRVTLSGLRAFAQYCPHLASLEIPFDASEVPSLEDVYEHTAANHALAVLVATSCPMTAVRPVFEFLLEAFPNLTTIRTYRTGWGAPRASEYDKLWKDVQSLLPK